ncbi:hypothetical protein [Escherichia coli]|uniref:hypothetical protein n=1 Tax=Escherichia coli TaxID=562 RepID=UPI0028830269|nr:hypothetical protein [Escherichia coli]
MSTKLTGYVWDGCLKELITVMKSGDELIVWKLDRLGLYKTAATSYARTCCGWLVNF